MVGGGKVAFRKVKRLVKTGAEIKLVSPRVLPEIEKLLTEEQISREKYRSSFCQDKFLVFAATDNKELNKKIYYNASKNGVLVNVADNPELCDFMVPALVNKGDLQIAISSGGKSPALAKKIRKELENDYNNKYSEMLNLMGELRELIKENVADMNKRKLILNKLAEMAQIKEN